MLMSKRFRITSIIWRVAVIVFLVFSFFDPTMLIFALISGGLSYIAHRRGIQAETREAAEAEMQSMAPKKRSALKAQKGPAGAKKGRMKTMGRR